MDERQEKSILEMGRGAIMERADYEMRAMIRNILDPNTSAKAARKLNITLTFKPGDDRQTIVVECVAKSTLASTNAITTMLYVLDEDTVVEMAPQIPGQLAVDAGEQEAPPKLRLIHCGRAYVITPSGAQEVIETPIVPATLQLHSLDSIVKMIRTEAIHLADANTPALFVNIPSPTNVTCFSQPDFTQRCVRAVFYSAGATDVPGWDAKVTLGFEEAQIALRTRFQETGDSLYAMKLVNDISLGAKVIYNDNGVATTVTTKSGVSLQTNEAIRPIVKLRPYRTFQEVEQPESTFLIRINDRGISFIEADGGMWRLTARNTIKAFLEEKLAAEIESGKLVVAL